MTKKEMLNTIKNLEKTIGELKEYAKQLDEEIGFKDDVLFLMSLDEYKRYKDKIRYIKTWWWLRNSYGYSSTYAYFINSDGFSSYGVAFNDYGVRPCLRYNKISLIIDLEEENCFLWNKTKWRIIDEKNKIAISDLPIEFKKFDGESNDYETSDIRAFLKEWSGLEY